MFFPRFFVTALSFSAAALAAPIGLPDALPVDGLVPSPLPTDIAKFPLDTSKLPLPISGGSVPSIGSGTGGFGLPLVHRDDSTYAGALDNLGSVAEALLNNLNGAQGLDASNLLSGLTDLNGALGKISSVLSLLQGQKVDSLLAGVSLEDVTDKTKSVFQTVNGVMAKVQSLKLTSAAKDELLTTVKTVNDIISGLGIAPGLQADVKALLAQIIGLVGGVLGGLGINL
ncbi:hypothetical protein OPQ81_004127 [Rhizoctonia solani]|nr:hypothetical protein OPQ81_004127 [Rhizoctonia solani]